MHHSGMVSYTVRHLEVVLLLVLLGLAGRRDIMWLGAVLVSCLASYMVHHLEVALLLGWSVEYRFPVSLHTWYSI